MSNASVVNGKLRHWSPSQINTFELCERRWGFERVDRLPGDYDSGAQARGTNIHNQLEAHGKTGTRPTDPLAIVASELLPVVTGRLVEFEASLKNPPLVVAGVPAKGFIDRLDYTNPQRIHVIDYKSRGSFRYCLTEEQLAHNTQLVTYAAWADEKFRADVYELEHFYIKTEAPPDDVPADMLEHYYRANTQKYFRRSSVLVTRDEVRTAFRAVESTVERMVVAAKASTGAALKPNYSACYAYGKPCPYMAACPRTAYAAINPGTTDSTGGAGSVAELLAARGTTTATPPPVRATGINPPDAAPVTRPPRWTPPSPEAPVPTDTQSSESPIRLPP